MQKLPNHGNPERLETPLAASPTCRRQLTLFVPAPWGPGLEALRQVLDPVQASLIASHVTLCRENENEGTDPELLFERIGAWAEGPLRLRFSQAERFNGHGILLPCEDGMGAFQRLRRWILQNQNAREHGAHLTLAHPRNPRALGNTDAALAACPQGVEIRFAAVALIEQQGVTPWRVIKRADLGGAL